MSVLPKLRKTPSLMYQAGNFSGDCQNIQEAHQSYKAIQVETSESLNEIQVWISSPRNYEEAVELDNENGNNKWQDAIDLELQQSMSTKSSKDLGKATYEKEKVTNLPSGYHKI